MTQDFDELNDAPAVFLFLSTTTCIFPWVNPETSPEGWGGGGKAPDIKMFFK